MDPHLQKEVLVTCLPRSPVSAKILCGGAGERENCRDSGFYGRRSEGYAGAKRLHTDP